MSDYAHSDYAHGRSPPPTHAVESRALFAAFYVLFLVRAVLTRLLPWQRPAPYRDGGPETVFGEARIAASVMVSSSFMGM